MLLVLDVGNTNITAGVFNGKDLEATFRLTTAIPRTSDEYGFMLKDLLSYNSIPEGGISHAAVCSVVPNIMHSLISGIIKYLDIYPLIINSEINIGLKIKTENPKQVGADRLADASGAYLLYGGPVIVVDYGTATTYDLVSGDGAFIAGVTAPGVRISAKALSDFAANLPEIEIVRPNTILAKETISSMQAGLYYGQVGQAEHIINTMKKEAGFSDIKVIATGGLGDMISRGTDCIDIYDPNLTLFGIRNIFELNNGKEY